MLAKLPRWVWIGAWALAFVAGMVNAVGLLSFEHRGLTHMTGLTTSLGVAIAQRDGVSLVHAGGVMLAFVLGALVSGLIIQDSALRIGGRYSSALLLETVLLVIAAEMMKVHDIAGFYFAAAAVGLQNAMASTYSGSAIRTSHVSGMFTDLGIYLGHFVRRIPVDPLRVRLCVTIISAFLCGGVGGAFAFRWAEYNALYVPAAVTGVMSFAYLVYRVRLIRRLIGLQP